MKLRTLSFLLIALISFIACNNSTNKNNDKENPDSTIVENKNLKDTIIKKWSTDKVLDVPESVKYDKQRDLIYVANISGKPSEKDGTGFISKLSMDGEIINKKWITGIDAPKGMGVYDSMLYVSNITQLVIINIDKEEIVQKIDIPETAFLNDIDIDQNGNVYISDSGTGKIYKFANGKYKLWINDTILKGTNGLYVEENNLLIGTKNGVFKANLQSAELQQFINIKGSIDGLESDGEGNYIISDWRGNVHRIGENIDKKLLFSTVKDTINAADIDFIKNQNLLLVPTFFDNRVMMYEVY